MKVGLIDVDSHNFPNLALMKISAYHKNRGDSVEWWNGFQHYDVVYKLKIMTEQKHNKYKNFNYFIVFQYDLLL